MHTARKYVVRGRVQGVGFRWFVENTANSLGLRGWARNLDDGSVEVYGVGTEEQHEELAARLWRGRRRRAWRRWSNWRRSSRG